MVPIETCDQLWKDKIEAEHYAFAQALGHVTKALRKMASGDDGNSPRRDLENLADEVEVMQGSGFRREPRR